MNISNVNVSMANKRFKNLCSVILFVCLTVVQCVYAQNDTNYLAQLQQSLMPMGQGSDFAPLIQRAGQARLVLIGDSTHGSQEFYQQRIDISKRLIEEKGFKFIALEGAWPNVYPLNLYIHSNSPYTAEQALNVVNPNAAWLWGNRPMLEFIQWLRQHNEQLPTGEQKVSLYGMDIYSFNESRELVIDYLQMFSPQAAQQAKHRYQCFERFNFDMHRYAQAVSRNPALSCESAVKNQYLDFSECRIPCPEQYSVIDAESFFYAMQNARIVKNFEQAMRLKYLTGEQAALWNLRDQHMLETIVSVWEHLQQPKTIIWAHSSHLGDARATELAQFRQLNLGQLVRQQFPQQAFLIGMLTYSGTVMAADDWNRPFQLKALKPAHPDSNEALFHSLGVNRFLLFMDQPAGLFEWLNQSRLQRHVGVVYRPQDEMQSHYSWTRLASQFDAIIFHDVTSAIDLLPSQ